MYERLEDALGQKELDEAAYAALETLLEPSPEVFAAGISKEQWQTAIRGMLASADAIDAQRADDAAAQRRSAWPSMRRDLEGLGCGVSRSPDNADGWRIVGHGVDIEVDLATGETDEHDLYYERDPFAKLVEYVAGELESRRLRDATDARKQALRLTHDWNNKLKGWVPKDGNGPIIKGGGRAAKA